MLISAIGKAIGIVKGVLEWCREVNAAIDGGRSNPPIGDALGGLSNAEIDDRLQ